MEPAPLRAHLPPDFIRKPGGPALHGLFLVPGDRFRSDFYPVAFRPGDIMGSGGVPVRGVPGPELEGRREGEPEAFRGDRAGNGHLAHSPPANLRLETPP